MDIDQVVEIPDTPDRISARRSNGVRLGKESNLRLPGPSGTSDFRNKECLDQPRTRSRLVKGNGSYRNLHLNSGKNPVTINEVEPCNKSSTFSTLRNSHPSQNASLFRRGSLNNNSKTETRHSNGIQHLDKGKSEFTKSPAKLPVHVDPDVLFDMAFPHGASKVNHSEETRGVIVSSNGSSSLHFPPQITGRVLKGKGKVDVSACNTSGSAMHHGKGIDLTGGSPHDVEKQMNRSHSSVTSPRVTGHKRLVRNGCISPYNIATRQQKFPESWLDASTNVGKEDSKNMVSDGASEVDIREIVAGEKNELNNSRRAKGKGLVMYPSTSMKHDTQIVNLCTSSGTNDKVAIETSDSSRGNASLDGWRRTHIHTKKSHGLHDGVFVDEQYDNRVARRNNCNKNVTRNAHDSGDMDERQTVFRPVPGLSQTNRPHHTGIHTKRQRKHGLTARIHSELSTVVPHDSEATFLDSSRESSSSRSFRSSNRHRRDTLYPIYEIDESSPERRTGTSQGLHSVNDEEEDARARQLEADEIMARELQEQFYHETPIFGGNEIDEHAAWLLQQEEDVFPSASSQNYPMPHLRRSATMRANRQLQSRSFQNPLSRRGTQSRLLASRGSQLRNHSPAGLTRARNRSHTLSTTRNFPFPVDMDLEMRLNILEALEDMSMTNSRILQFQSDFNENDYEMLLALDENNHQHGASADRINSLPESVLQTDNFEETCAICLDTPTIGETIRHLPCLHKFHKDCIDPWLRRKTSCPVCKSSIT